MRHAHTFARFARNSHRSLAPRTLTFRSLLASLAAPLLCSRFARACLLASLAFPACCSLRSLALPAEIASLASSPAARSAARCLSPARWCSRFARRLSCLLAPLAASPAPLNSSPAARSARRLACRSRRSRRSGRSPAAARFARGPSRTGSARLLQHFWERAAHRAEVRYPKGI